MPLMGPLPKLRWPHENSELQNDVHVRLGDVGRLCVNQCYPANTNDRPGLARPNQIWVYDFVAASSDVPADSALAGQVGAPSAPSTPEEIETGRRYGAMIA